MSTQHVRRGADHPRHLRRPAALVAPAIALVALALGPLPSALAATPTNDDFVSATVVSTLPFADTVDASQATVEAGEPAPSCGWPSPSIWYAYTTTTSATLTAGASYFGYQFALQVYTGSSLASLQGVACGIGQVSFAASAGTTYYFQVLSGSTVQFQLGVAPPPQAGFYFYPSDPSMYDTVQFYGNPYDPAGMGIASETWDLGDGTSATACCPSHAYPLDGDYTVSFSVTTFDGRSGSSSQVLHVRTHDVAITKFSVPTSASAGQTRQVTVGVSDTRYPESVQVQLFVSAPGGSLAVGALTQAVPVRSANRTTSFTFDYTFTAADASIGKVTFGALATILGARDALPADNTATALPTRVTR